jgi:hypothetical protein
VSLREDERRSVTHSTVGGVTTDEVGAVTGNLEITPHLLDACGLLDVRVRYAGAEEWYTVAESPVAPGDSYPTADLHERVVEYLSTPALVVGGNEEPTSLRGFALA